MEDNAALFIPAINEEQKNIIAQHFEHVGAKIFGINLPLTRGWSLDDYNPWWYLFTPNFVAGLLKVCGFKVLEIVEVWEGRAAYFLAKRNQALK